MSRRSCAFFEALAVSLLMFSRAASADSPVIQAVDTRGDVTWSVGDNGIYASIAPPLPECHYDPATYGSGPITAHELQLVVTPNQGGYLRLAYRLESRGFTDNGGVDGMRVAAFAVQINSGYPIFLVEDYHWVPACSRIWDTGWIEVTLRLPPSVQNQNYTVRLGIANRGGGGEFSSHVDIRNLAVVCDTYSAVSAKRVLAPTTETAIDTVRSPSPALNFANLRPLEALAQACKGCCIAPLTALPTGDTDSNAQEHLGKTVWREKLVPALQTAEQCLNGKVVVGGGVYRLTSAFRTEWYQQHLREVWDKFDALQNNQQPECAPIKASVVAEFQKHALRFKPAGVVPRHTTGEAIDIKWQPAFTGLTEAILLQFADECGLYRRVPKDKPHFELKPGNP